MKTVIALLALLILLTSCSSENDEFTFDIANEYTEEELQEIKEAVESINERRNEFVKIIGEALNVPELPIMSEKVYFNSDNDLIIEVNGEWLVLDESLRKDMIYALEEVLKQNKILVNSSGYVQFFSTSGQSLESFYVD
ncbi:hypothetical protein [uncultured Tissierella sp.]|uniref:hypothetical protein n=1 Tax=uncultured Tissierella sp. TaxID=448160 RepID=UPI0028063A4A|nr:hypothetical protein [uncultured Tissierella sp.]MDU5081210.1 hypothetical protein [Bacillota bacterium]